MQPGGGATRWGQASFVAPVFPELELRMTKPAKAKLLALPLECGCRMEGKKADRLVLFHRVVAWDLGGGQGKFPRSPMQWLASLAG